MNCYFPRYNFDSQIETPKVLCYVACYKMSSSILILIKPLGIKKTRSLFPSVEKVQMRKKNWRDSSHKLFYVSTEKTKSSILIIFISCNCNWAILLCSPFWVTLTQLHLIRDSEEIKDAISLYLTLFWTVSFFGFFYQKHHKIILLVHYVFAA